MNQALKSCFDWMVLIALWCLMIFMIGGFARLAKELFCLGYVCGG